MTETVKKDEKQQEQPAQESEEQTEQQDDSFDPEKAQERGWFGNRPEVFSDEEFALTTGPNSPGQADLEDPDSYDSSKTVTEKE